MMDLTNLSAYGSCIVADPRTGLEPVRADIIELRVLETFDDTTLFHSGVRLGDGSIIQRVSFLHAYRQAYPRLRMVQVLVAQRLHQTSSGAYLLSLEAVGLRQGEGWMRCLQDRELQDAERRLQEIAARKR